jgi:hypothetical protein
LGKSKTFSRRNTLRTNIDLKMKKKDEFYIGYYPEAPQKIAKTVKIAVFIVILAILSTAFVITKNEKGFSNSQFEYGTLTELEGVLYRKPVPMLRVLTGKIADGHDLYKSVLLVNFQKFGAENLLIAYTEKGVSEGESLVKLRGTLIYHDGVTVMELTEQENALCGKVEKKNVEKSTIEVRKPANIIENRMTENLGEITLQGEIIDPKCYFGAMKPAESSPHRDCAIRCISGGIPPVFVVKNPQNEANYMLITDENGNAINEKILEFVGIPIRLKGKLEKIDEWFVLRINPPNIEISDKEK